MAQKGETRCVEQRVSINLIGKDDEMSKKSVSEVRGGLQEDKENHPSQEFSWNGGSVVVPRVSAIAVYCNPDGDVVIRQEDVLGDDDEFVIVPVKQLDLLIDALQKVIQE